MINASTRRAVIRALGLGLLLVMGTGCLGRGMAVHHPQPGDIARLQGHTFDHVYFVPFGQTALQLKGDHGDEATAEANKAKWFSHLVVGAQDAFDDELAGVKVVYVGERPAYIDVVLEKYETSIEFAAEVPSDAYVVTGRYLFSEEISGGARAMLGVMVGKSWTRAEISISQGGEAIYGCTIDGKYMGTAYSWGYETLGSNEGLGRGIVEVILNLHRGEPIEVD